jgi:membrane associated rhomboid family serine protease
MAQTKWIETGGESKEGFGEGLRRRGWTIGMFVGVIWLVWLLDALALHGSLVQYGVVPRTVDGLVGVLWAPFLHANWTHAASNTMGIIFLGGLVILRNEAHFWIVSILGALVGGLGTWVIGRGDAVHVGASGVIFAYFGYLMFAGIFERRIGTLLLSLVVFVLWGGMLWQVLPTRGAVSWEGHVSGLAGGALAARVLARRESTEITQ